MTTDTRATGRRVIIDTDAKNEADDQYAIVHAILSPTLDVRGLVAAHFGHSRVTDSMRASREEIDLLLTLMDLDEDTDLAVDGAPTALQDETTPVDSAGARLIIEEAHRDDDSPLYVVCLGPLTDMASALLLDPTVRERDVVVVWVGGGPYGDQVSFGASPEYNLGNDIAAANVVFGSGLPIWQVPSPIYRLLNVGYAELRAKVAPHGEIGRYLVDQLVAWNAAHLRTPMESRPLGDSAAIGLLIEPWCGVFRAQSPVRFGPDGSYQHADAGGPILVCESLDTRFIMEDFFAKISQRTI